MELRTLRYFLAVAQEKNITRAAEILHLTQPTLSRQMSELEQELGTTLLERGKRSLTLTEDGLLFRQRAADIVELADRTQQEFAGRREEISGLVAVGASEALGGRALAGAMQRFSARYPAVRFELYNAMADPLRERIDKGALDLALLLEPVDTSRYQILRLPVRESWGVLVPEDSPLARREAVTPGDLADSPLILTTRELMRREMIRWFGPYADRIQVAASGNLPYNQTQLAREGLGIYLVIRLDCAYDGLRFVPLSPPLESGTVLAWKKTEVLSATAAALLRFAEKYVGGISDHPV